MLVWLPESVTPHVFAEAYILFWYGCYRISCPSLEEVDTSLFLANPHPLSTDGLFDIACSKDISKVKGVEKISCNVP